jgi:hypothetical protein
MKCFIPPIKIGSFTILKLSQDFDRDLKEQILRMKKILTNSSHVNQDFSVFNNVSNDINNANNMSVGISNKNNHETKINTNQTNINHTNTNQINATNINKVSTNKVNTNKINESSPVRGRDIHSNENTKPNIIKATKTEKHDMAIRESAYDDIKKSITLQLKEKYGDDICVDFAYDDINVAEKEDILYSLKIKEIGKSEPNPKEFSESEIYINTSSKQFCIKTKDGFQKFPLTKRSVVKCEKNY